MQNNISTSIHIVLKELIEAKSKRDKIKFTSYQLANALSMPRSIISKLTNPDESKRILNPRIETLIKIVDFFREDGFDITIDDLLKKKTDKYIANIGTYSLSNLDSKIGNVQISTSSNSTNLVALHAEKDISPFFKSGSIFIVDRDKNPEHENLIAIKFSNSEEVQIKKYLRDRNKIILQSLDYQAKDSVLLPTEECTIVGVIVQVNAKI